MSKAKGGKRPVAQAPAPEQAAAPQAQTQASAQEQVQAPAQDTAEKTDATKNSGKHVNIRITETEKSVRRDRPRRDGNGTFTSVTIPMQIDGKTRFGSIAVNNGCVTPATNPVYEETKDANGNTSRTVKRDDQGKVVTTPATTKSGQPQLNIYLGEPTRSYKVNYATDEKTADGKTVYKNESFSASQIQEMNKAARDAYKSTSAYKSYGNNNNREVPDVGNTAPSGFDETEIQQ